MNKRNECITLWVCLWFVFAARLPPIRTERSVNQLQNVLKAFACSDADINNSVQLLVCDASLH